MVKVHDREGLTNHAGPESCVAAREGRGEALTGEGASRVSSREISALVRKREVNLDADAVGIGGRRNQVRRDGETHEDPARSKTPSACPSISYGSREISCSPATLKVAGRGGKPKGERRRCTNMRSRTGA